MAGAEQGPHSARLGGRSAAPRKNRVGAGAPSWQNAPMHDYERIARIIRFLDTHQAEQPDLAALAGRAGLSPFHFHRLFTRWAAVTPKDFLQCLTLERARAALRAGEGVLETAIAAGLSGPGRLHDLCVSLEAASPGEIKSGGAGWDLMGGFVETPFGNALIGESPRGICHLSFIGAGNEGQAWDGLRADWPGARLRRDDGAAGALAARVFTRDGEAAGPPVLRALVRGTAFQVRVWRALLRIPPGALISYGRLAAALGAPGAARAVGAAVGGNSIAYLIPCHRVIRETGAMGGYRWGVERKRAMLAWEGGVAKQ